ncbi:MAG: pyruvate kinase [Coxiellaceae bacterium]|jgi:pyruvate kinase|nr:pyruvate kinase [Coxiellaceae bacterium]
MQIDFNVLDNYDINHIENIRRTKIVATLGPSSNSLDALRRMIAAGVDVVRLNFSHGTIEERKNLVNLVRLAAKAEGKIVGVLADLQGPKIRIAKFKTGKVILKENDIFVLDASLSRDIGDETAVGVDYKELPRDVKAGDVLLLDDGRLVFAVEKVIGARIICRVKVGGELSNNKGINRQGGGLSAGALTDKDREDIITAVTLKVDYIAVSFVRSKSDIEEAKALIAKAGGGVSGMKVGVIAKIERCEAIVPKNLQEIIRASDGIMVARGDLAVEIGDANVPGAQKLMIHYARLLRKPIITATQMMETMIHNVVPTRAEVSDVANAVLDGTDAVMLSAETAVGKHPSLVIQTVSRVCLAAEKLSQSSEVSYQPKEYLKSDEAVAAAAMYIATHLRTKAVVSLTETGSTALLISRVRSNIPIYGLSRDGNALGRMALYNNVYPIEFDVTGFKNNSELKQAVLNTIKRTKLVNTGDSIVITNGDNIGVTGKTNSLTILQAI